jgi:hypothetical protein
MAVRLQGGILPPVWVYHELARDEAMPTFTKHTRGYLLHETEPMPAMTEEEAYRIPNYERLSTVCMAAIGMTGNKPKMVICRKEQLPSTREWRNAWKITEELSVTDLAA